jgi:transcriptional regulator GlxA family with amidase domain
VERQLETTEITKPCFPKRARPSKGKEEILDARVDFLIGHMKRDIQQRLSADVMASMVNLSTSRIAHLFKREAQVSPQLFIKMMRMQRAKLLLETSFLNVKQVMIMAGFNDASHFVRDFKRLFGKTPGQYRREYKVTSSGSS